MLPLVFYNAAALGNTALLTHKKEGMVANLILAYAGELVCMF